MKKGSITVYASLTLLVLLSLLAAGLYSARQAAGRVVCASALEQSLFSLFGQYDKELLSGYGLLFLDGGYGGTSLRPGQWLQEVETEVDAIFHPGRGLFASGRDLLGVRLQEETDSITGYVLATDDGGRAFRRQICETMQKKLGPGGLLFLQDTLQTQQEEIAAQEAAYEAYEIPTNWQLPEIPPAEGGEGEVPLPPEEPAWFFDPLETLRSLRAAGVLAMTLPRAQTISAAETDRNELVSGRTLQKGMGMAADGWEGTGEKLLQLEYLAERFACYTTVEERAPAGLQYQIEYAISGKASDRENLQDVLLQLLYIREATNFLHILRSSTLRSEAERLADLISLLLLQPELQPAIAIALEAAWAYGESILDLQELLAGGKIPLIKNDASWQLPLAELPFVRLRPPASGERNSAGLDYAAYLRLLLFTKSAEELTAALMDLTELQIREGGRPGFRLDCCVDALQVELTASVGRNQYRIERSYGYNA